jgi:hypothetical protein
MLLGDIKAWIGTIVVLFLLGIVGYSLARYGSDAEWYAVKYKVPVTRVHVEPKPKDCDWGYAPVGNKGCAYKAEATPYTMQALRLFGCSG